MTNTLNKELLLRLNNVKKTYGKFTALHTINLAIKRGEFHALVGENGAGKSTLINIVTGVVQSDTGFVEFENNRITTLNPSVANELGILTVHQELSLSPSLSIVDNLFLGRQMTNAIGIRKKKEMYRLTRQLLDEVKLSHLRPNQIVSTLTLAEQQLLEFIKAFHQKPKLLILDEATSALDANQVELVFNKIKGQQEKGMAVIFISHRLQELFTLCDRMTVLKDGKQVMTDEMNGYDNDDLIKLMTGREFSDLFPVKNSMKNDNVILQLNGVSTQKIKDIHFHLNHGEILGIGGLQGQGQEEILKVLFGMSRIEKGSVVLNGKKVKFKKPNDAIENGIAYLPSDRTSESLLLEHSILFNSTLTNLKKISNVTSTINKKVEKSLVENGMSKMQVSARSTSQPVGALSGGNQQKVAILKWIERNPQVLLLNEPTRGIDVGTKKEIYNLLKELSGKGISIIIISSEALELVGLCNRIVVMYENEVNDIIDGDNLTEEKLVRSSVLKRGGEELV